MFGAVFLHLFVNSAVPRPEEPVTACSDADLQLFVLQMLQQFGVKLRELEALQVGF